MVVSSTSTVSGSWSYKTGYSKIISNPFPIDFASETANMKALSAEIASYSDTNGVNITPTGSGWRTAEFVGTDATLNVFNLNASGGVNEVRINCPTGSQIIINVTDAGTFALPNVFVWNGSSYVQLSGETQPIDHTLLWNFDSTTSITSSYVMTRGAILAPYAAVNLTGGNSNGTIICNSYMGSSEIHWSAYTSGFSFLAVPNTMPDATTDTENTSEDTPVIIDVLTNDTDADGDTLTVTGITTAPSQGTCEINADGTITYTPDEDYSGTDTFVYAISDGNGGTDTATVTITITAANDAPTVPDYNRTTTEETAVTGTVVGTDIDSATLTYAAGTLPGDGTVSVDTDGNWTYTPDEDFNGTDTFTVIVSDGNGGTATSTITITVTGVNDAPDATTDTENTSEDTPVIIDVLTNDTDPDGDALTVTDITTDPSHGTCVVNPDGTITYTPNKDYSGTDSFVYAISDGNGGTDTATVTITITAANDAPKATDDSNTTTEKKAVTGTIVGTDIDSPVLTYTTGTLPGNGKVTVDPNGNWTYTPNENFHGVDSFTVIVSDGNGGTTTSTITITVNVDNGVTSPDNPTDTTIKNDGITKTGEIADQSQTLLGAILLLTGLVLITLMRKKKKNT